MKMVEEIGRPASLKPPLRDALLVLGVALAVRFSFLFLAAPIQWDWDSYHHWQISYYTLHVGLGQGRMWDLGGMEYFWGILPELIQAFFLWLLRTSSMLPFRVFNATVGGLSCFLVYRIGLKYLDRRTALVSSVLCALCPTLVAWDASGVNEPLGIFFLLLSLLLYEDRPYLCGLSLGLASMCRIEYWFLTMGVCMCYIIFERSGTKIIPSLAGWLTMMGPYFYFLQTRTGDFLYPIRWNYLCSVGAWGPSPASWIPPESIPWKSLWAVILASSAYVLARIYRRKPADYMIFTFFTGFLLFQGILYTVSFRYVAWPWTLDWLLSPWSPGGLHDRPWMLDFIFLAILLPRALPPVHFNYKLVKRRRIPILGVTLILLFASWLGAMSSSYNQLSTSPAGIKFWFGMADVVVDSYRGGTVITEGPPMVTYELVHRGIPCQNILGTLYSPLYYGGDETQCLEWFKNANATWYIHDSGINIFPELARSKSWGPFHFYHQCGSFIVYEVKFTS